VTFALPPYDSITAILWFKSQQLLPGPLDVIAEQHALAILRQDGAEALLAFDHATVCQVLAITVHHVEGDEARLARRNRS